MRYLIINADDYGFSEEINLGVCEAFVHGVVTDSSLLVYSPYAEQALSMASEVRLPVGIHLDLVTDFVEPCSPYFGANGSLVKTLYRREFEERYDTLFTCDQLICVRDEMRAQVNRFMDMAGKPPSHLDYHYGLHYLPEVMAIYVSVAEEYGLPIRWGSQYAGKNPYRLAPTCLCDRFRGMQAGCLELFVELVREPWQEVMELVCHPGYLTPGALPDRYNQERQLELKALTDPRIRPVLEELGICLVGFDWLKDGRRPIEEIKRKDGNTT